jgi:hypothetical protein
LFNTAKSLYVERVDLKNCRKIQRIAEDWQIFAQRKIAVVSDRLDAYSRLIASSNVARSISLQCHLINNNPAIAVEWQKEIYVCKDTTDRVQGIAIVSKKLSDLSVDCVMTHPANIRCKANELEPNRVEGAGRVFCAFLESEALKQHVQSVYLTALPASRQFYLKFGFEEGSEGKLVKSFFVPQICAKL